MSHTAAHSVPLPLPITLWRACLAEFVGTAVLVVGGVGTAVLAGNTVGDLGIALAFGFTLLALVFALGPISGCHVNPAVTLAMLAVRRIRTVRAGGYVIAQLLGGIAGAAVVAALARGRAAYNPAVDGLGANGYGDQSPTGYDLASVTGAEVLLTFVLVLVVLAATDRLATSAVAGLPIGIVLAVVHLVAIPIDSTSVNPARSLGPALLTGGPALAQVGVFLVAPLVGGLLAAAAHRVLFGSDPNVAPASTRTDTPTSADTPGVDAAGSGPGENASPVSPTGR